MVAVFNLVGSLVDDPVLEPRGVSDLELINLSGSWYVAAAAEADSAISLFSIGAGGTYTQADVQSFSNAPGTRAISDLGTVFLSGQTVLIPASRYENQTALFAVLANGTLSGPVNATDTALVNEGLGLSQSVTIGAQVYVFAQSYGGSELAGYALSSSLDLTRVETVTDTAQIYLSDISAMATTAVGNSHFLYVASAFDGAYPRFMSPQMAA